MTPARIHLERSGSLIRATAEAPAGFIWDDGHVHELVSESRGGAEAKADVKRDIRARISVGMSPCVDPECDWCTP